MSEKFQIAILHPIPEVGLKILEQQAKLQIHSEQKMTATQLAHFVKGADAIVSCLTDPITDELMEAAGPQLRVIAQYAVGFDNIDLAAARKRDIQVIHTPGSLSAIAVAEHSLNLLLSLARHTIAADQYVRSGRYKGWDPTLFLGTELSGKTLGIVGAGRIGSQFAAICHNGLRMRVLYHDLKRNTQLEKDLGALSVSLEKLLIQADVVSLYLPLLPSTHHLIGKEQFTVMKPSSLLINTSRGPIIDEKALVTALRDHKIGGAALDVYEKEPELALGLTKLQNVVLSPHIGSATLTTRQQMAESISRNLLLALQGNIPANLVS